MAAEANSNSDNLTLDKVREALIRQEDTIVFRLIQRANFPVNSPTYDEKFASFSGSLLQFVVKETEALQSKVGRYENPEEQPFFPENLPPSLVPPQANPPVLHPAAASININEKIWDFYFNQLLPLFAVPGDDGNYASTASSDLDCLQAISRRIHYGYYVAEVKFKDAPQDYEPAIRAQDREGLMKLLTFEAVEEMVKKRVEKKAAVFGQDVCLVDNGNGKCKVDPSVVSRLYGEWIMPLTKLVQVEYLLRRLD
ncbi:chorismate mutase 2 [Prunus avium]|uniref:Chorismate mutase n=1 Tax=Prunus avium TaxID=42229 RepID=A0A6P5T2N4_PRUAV|nr:chorismate mutase 2 [Prunus avium]